MPVSPDTLEWFVPLSSISANALAEIAAQAEERSYTAGSILFREGDSDTVLYFLLEGEVQRLESGGKNQMLNAGQDDARYALARTVPRIYTAKAMTSVRVICIEGRPAGAPSLL